MRPTMPGGIMLRYTLVIVTYAKPAPAVCVTIPLSRASIAIPCCEYLLFPELLH